MILYVDYLEEAIVGNFIGFEDYFAHFSEKRLFFCEDADVDGESHQ